MSPERAAYLLAEGERLRAQELAQHRANVEARRARGIPEYPPLIPYAEMSDESKKQFHVYADWFAGLVAAANGRNGG